MNENEVPLEYIKPDSPRSNWEIFKWLFFEPSLLNDWSEHRLKDYWGDSKKIITIYLLYFLPLILVCWILMISGLAFFDIPGSSPSIFNNKIDSQAWQQLSSFHQKWLLLTSQLALELAFGLIFGLALGLICGLAFELITGLAFGLTFGLIGGLTGGFSGGLADGLADTWAGKWAEVWARGWNGGLIGELAREVTGGLTIELVVGLVIGLTGGVTVGLLVGLTRQLTLQLARGLTGGLVGGLIIGFSFGLSYDPGSPLGFGLGLGAVIGFYAIYFRVAFYPIYLFLSFKNYSLLLNPYLKDEEIWLPLFKVKRALKTHAKQDPQLAFHFVNFLLRYRRLQRKLAAEIEHTATAAFWCSSLYLKSLMLENRHVLAQEVSDAWKNYTPSSGWREKVIEIRETLRSVEATTAIVTQQALLQKCLELVQDFEAINLREPFKGREEYFTVITHWRLILNNQLQEVSKKVAESHSISLNPYSKGNALSPEQNATAGLFLDRNDLKEALSLKIQTSAIVPTFLLLGQRRVGKTSLLNFLPRLLDPNYYDVVSIDAQALSGETSLVKWLQDWAKSIQSKLKLPITDVIHTSSPLQAWDEFAAYLNQLAQKRQCRLILAMDEYDSERGFHYAICQNAGIGEALLGRMRAFSQQQKMIVFMFVGATSFSDLPEPKWSRYFVQAHIVRVDYLSEQASLQLIENPIPNFGLKYAEGIAQYIYQQTQGHPHLLHSICSDLVDYANLKLKNPIEQVDVEYIFREKIVLPGEQPFSVFWDEFCEKIPMREAIKAIAWHKPVDTQTVEVRKLQEYGYIVKDGNGSFRMRVPLFEEWVREFGY